MPTSLVRRKRLSSGSRGKDDRFEPTFTCVGQESIHDVRGIGEDTEVRLPAIVGGLSVALARTFRIIEPQLKNPRTKHWERVFRAFNLLL